MKRVTLFLTVTVLLAASVYLLYNEGIIWKTESNQDTVAAFAETGVSIPLTPESHASFYSAGDDRFFYCTNDGIAYTNLSGETEWLADFAFREPVLIGEGKIAAVGEPNGNLIIVFDNKGELYRTLFEDALVLSYSLNKQGYLAVILKRDNHYETHVYDNSGNQIWTMMHLVSNVYPVAVDISQDNRIIALNLLDLRDLSVVSGLTFCYLNTDEAKGYTDSVFASKNKQDQVIAALSFLEDGTLVSLSEEEVCGITFENNNEVKYAWEIPLNNKVEIIAYYGDRFALALGSGLINRQPEPTGTVQIYNSKGVLTGSEKLDKVPSFINLNYGNCMVGIGKTVYALNEKGKILWEYNALQHVEYAARVNNSDNLLIVNENEALMVKKQI